MLFYEDHKRLPRDRSRFGHHGHGDDLRGSPVAEITLRQNVTGRDAGSGFQSPRVTGIIELSSARP
mgnify:CR=1 FL=1